MLLFQPQYMGMDGMFIWSFGIVVLINFNLMEVILRLQDCNNLNYLYCFSFQVIAEEKDKELATQKPQAACNRDTCSYRCFQST